MKKLSKILLSMCMVFMLAFSFVACNDADDDDEDKKYSPPAGVDMTSATEYAEWLLENADVKSSYQATLYYVEDNEIELKTIIKYQNNAGTQCFAAYDEENVMTQYMEFVDISATVHKVTAYYPDEMNYKEVLISNEEAVEYKATYSIQNSMAYMFLNYPTESVEPIPENVTISNEIKKVADGKYVLTKTVSMVEENETINNTYVYTYLNDRLVDYTFTERGIMTVMTYEYKDVTININKSAYSKTS